MERITKRHAIDTSRTTRRRPAEPSSGKLKLVTFESLDGRTVAARRVREIVDSISSDLGGDLTEGQRQLVRRASLLATILESSETKLLIGEPVDLSTYLSAVDRLRRVLTALGIERRSRDVSATMRPLDYARHRETRP
jgi:hypothetical protein